MGILKPCYSVSGDSVVIGVFALYDEATAAVPEPVTVLPGQPGPNPGFDDLLGEPFLEDHNDDQVGERVRPEIEARILGKLQFTRHKEQQQDATGNAPRSNVRFRVARKELEKKGLLVDGVIRVRANDRLRNVLNRRGRLLHDFEADGAPGFYVVEARPGETGSNVIDLILEQRRPVEQ